MIGKVLGEMRYKAWGETRYAAGDSLTDFAYTGQRQEPDLGFYYYKARWYDPALGRFMQADTIVPEAGNPMALDRYGYALNNPLAYTDSSGHWPCGDRPYCPGDWFDERLINFGSALLDPDSWDPIQQEKNQIMVEQGSGIFLDFAPIVGDIKGFIEVFTGVDIVTGDELGAWRVLGLIGISEFRNLRYLRHLDNSMFQSLLSFGSKHGDEIRAVFRSIDTDTVIRAMTDRSGRQIILTAGNRHRGLRHIIGRHFIGDIPGAFTTSFSNKIKVGDVVNLVADTIRNGERALDVETGYYVYRWYDKSHGWITSVVNQTGEVISAFPE